MTTPAKPKRQGRPRRPKLIPLLMLASDGECYCCAPLADLPEGVLKNPNAVVAIRLNRRERDLALDSLQDGVRSTAQLLAGIIGRKFDA